MIVCQCQSITDRQIRAAVDWMRAADPDTIITPGKVYRAPRPPRGLWRLHAAFPCHDAAM